MGSAPYGGCNLASSPMSLSNGLQSRYLPWLTKMSSETCDTSRVISTESGPKARFSTTMNGPAPSACGSTQHRCAWPVGLADLLKHDSPIEQNVFSLDPTPKMWKFASVVVWLMHTSIIQSFRGWNWEGVQSNSHCSFFFFSRDQRLVVETSPYRHESFFQQKGNWNDFWKFQGSPPPPASANLV